MPQRRRHADSDELLRAAAAGVTTRVAAGAAAGAAGAPARATGAEGAALAEPLELPAHVAHGALVIAILRRIWRGLTQRRDPRWLADVIRAQHPAMPETTLARYLRFEARLEAEALRRMRERLERDLPAALEADDPRAAVAALLEREKGYLLAHDRAAADRALAAVRRDQVRTLSPEGAYWRLSPYVKNHTPDCLAFAAVGWWPWEVLDAVHPPTHPGCQCELLTHEEAQREGLMGEIPDTTGAVARARQVIDAYGLLQEAYWDVPARSMTRDIPHEQARSEPARALQETVAGPDARALDLLERYDRRFAAGTAWGGRFMPREGGVAPLVRHFAEQIRAIGRDIGRPTHGRHGMGTPAEPAAAPRPELPGAGVPPGPLQGFSGANQNRTRPPADFPGLARAARDQALRLAHEYRVRYLEARIATDESLGDTAGLRSPAGDAIGVGPAADAYLRRAAEARAAGRTLDDDTASGVYLAYRATAHELGHNTNPLGYDTYRDDLPAAVLEEALAEEMAHENAVELLKAHGEHDALRWLGRSPGSSRALGMYRPQRAALLRVLDEAKVPLVARRDLLRQMAYGVRPESRVELMGGLHARANGLAPAEGVRRVRGILGSSAAEEPGPTGSGANVLEQRNYTDHRMRVRPGVRVRIDEPGKDPVEGVVSDAAYGPDGEWHAEVDTGDGGYRYPEPAQLHVVADAPRPALRGAKVAGAIPEGSRVQVEELNGQTVEGELSRLEPDDAAGWHAELTTDRGELVPLRPTSVAAVRQVGAERAPLAPPEPAVPPEPSAAPSALVGQGSPQTPPEAPSGPVTPLSKPAETSSARWYDPKHYSDPIRSLITKTRALPPDESLQAADGSTVTRGHTGDSVAVVRPDGTRKRYATVNRMARAEVGPMSERLGLKASLPLRTDDHAALEAMPSPPEGWQARIRAMSTEQRRALQVDLEQNMLAGWVAPGDDVPADDLVGLIGDAMNQHEADDVDTEALGPRRGRDEALLADAIGRATGMASPGEAPSDEAAKRLLDDWKRPELTSTQADAAELYILDADGFSGDEIYDPATDKTYDGERMRRALDKAMRPLPADVAVYRAGDRVPGWYVSTTTSRAVAAKYGNGRFQTVVVPKGTKALWLGGLTEGEDELLIGRDQEVPGMASPGEQGILGFFRREPKPERHLEAPPAPVAGIPGYADAKLKDVKAAGGTTGARIAEDKKGRRWLVKNYKGETDRVATEALANAVYRELGVPVPNAGVGVARTKKFGDTPTLTYPLVDGELRRWKGEDDQLGEGFVADALLANWDVVGLAQDNVLWNGETPIRVDQGGTLEYRAQGAKKPFGPVPTELWTMNSPKGQAFGRMKITEAGMRAQAADVAQRLTPARVDELVDAAPWKDEGMRERVRENLKARVAWLGRFAEGKEQLPAPLDGPETVDEFASRDRKLETYPDEDLALEHYAEHRDEVDQHLRSGAPAKAATPETQRAVEALDALLGDKVTRTEEEFNLYVPLGKFMALEDAQKLAGQWVTERSYLVGAAQFEPTLGATIVRVRVPEGSHALMPSVLAGLTDASAGEVILPRRTRLRIVRALERNGAVVLDAVAVER